MRSTIFDKDKFATLVFDDGQHATVYKANPRFNELVEAILVQNWELARSICFPAEALQATIRSSAVLTDNITIQNGIVFYQDKPFHNLLATRLIQQLEVGHVLSNLIAFLENLMLNPSHTARNELYLFMEFANLPITEDGCFIAYKRIRTNWFDHYSGTMDNSIGKIVEMDRAEVDDDRTNTCSKGLHFCSRSYLPSYGAPEGGRVIVVKINPKDVVSIPKDYNNAKGRTCRYEVLYELPLENKTETALPTESIEGLVATKAGVVVTSPSHPTASTNVVLVATSTDNERDQRFFETVEAAANTFGIEKSAINRVLRGDRLSTNGYYWEWRNAAATPAATSPTPEDKGDGEWYPEDDDRDYYDDDQY